MQVSVGGGAGGGGANHISGAGGYSSGIAENQDIDVQVYNGKSFSLVTYVAPSASTSTNLYYWNGSGYLMAGEATPDGDGLGCHIGGQGGTDVPSCSSLCKLTCRSGDGGFAGSGGAVTVSENATIYAYNGNECTLEEGDSVYYYSPVNIYIQSGTPLDIYIHNIGLTSEKISNLKNLLGIDVSGVECYDGTNTITEYCFTKSKRGVSYAATSYGQGIGSGAGYIEVSNGTYVVDSSLN